MDFTQLDNLIERLEKRRITSGPPSSPEILNGHLGIWRTVRGFRVFMETNDSMSWFGRVLIGPPSFVGRKLGDVPGDVWEALTPRATDKAVKDLKVAANGIDVLKGAIKASLNPDPEKDTRHKAIDDTDNPRKLYEIARSAGLTDDEIKSALQGKDPVKVVPMKGPKKDEPKPEPKDSKVVTLTPPGSSADKPLPSGPSKSPAKEVEADNTVIEGALAVAPKSTGKDADKEFGEKLVEVSKSVKNDVLRKQLEKMGLGLQSGAYSRADVMTKMRDIQRDRNQLKDNASEKDLKTMRDRATMQEALENLDQKIEEKVNEAIERTGKTFTGDEAERRREEENLPEELREIIAEGREAAKEQQKEAEKRRKEIEAARAKAEEARRRAQEALSAAQLERLQVEAAVAVLQELAAQIESPHIKKEVEELASNLRTSPFNRRSILLRLYQLFQLLLLFIPL